MTMKRAKQAPVRPRVIAEDHPEGLPSLLEDEVADFLRAGARGSIALVGEAGTGKSTALRHLAAVFESESGVEIIWEERAALEAQHDRDEEASSDRARLQVYAARHAADAEHLAIYRPAPWDDDDVTEYLLNRHPTRCAEIRERLMQDAQRIFLEGRPELLSVVLDELAVYPLLDSMSALRQYLDERIPKPEDRLSLGHATLRLVLERPAVPVRLGLEAEFQWAASRRAIRCLLASEYVVDGLLRQNDYSYDWPESGTFPLDILFFVGRRARSEPVAVKRLWGLLDDHDHEGLCSNAASILAAVDSAALGSRLAEISESGATMPQLARAVLPGMSWPGLQLAGSRLFGANLTRSELQGARLDFIQAEHACLDRADLSRASLLHASLDGASLRGADLSAAQMKEASLRGADLSGAQMHRADLRRAHLSSACLESAELREADLRKAKLQGAALTGTDLREARLEKADLRDTDLRNSHLAGSDMRRANLRNGILEGIDWPRARLLSADLRGSDLAYSNMSDGILARTDLRSAGLAGVNWARVDLRGADLRGANFHLGSTRSGLLFSGPSWGTRTGFYTDEGLDAEATPEKVRTANLCQSDLRGALIEGTDFYRVDLRGAHYSPAQGRYLRQCGAILGEV